MGQGAHCIPAKLLQPCPADVTKISNKGDNLLLLQVFSGRVMQHDHCVILYSVTACIKKNTILFLFMQNIDLDIVTFSRVVEEFSITSSDLYQSSAQLSLCWACD